MKKPWYKKLLMWVLAVVIIALLSFGIPIVINELYKSNSSCLTLWGADDVLGFYGSFISFIGTVALGAVAVWQNERLQDLEARVVTKDESCNIYIEKASADRKECDVWKVLSNHTDIILSNEAETTYDTDSRLIEFIITNSSDAFLKKICLSFGNYNFISHLTLAKNQSKLVKINLPKDYIISNESICEISFISCYDVKTYGDFRIKTGTQYRAAFDHYHFYGLKNKERTHDDRT